MIHNGFLAFQSGLDLNFDSMTYGLLRRHAKGHHEPRQACFLSVLMGVCIEILMSLKPKEDGKNEN